MSETEHEELSQKCSDNVIEKTDRGHRLFLWHPQWGGYVGHAIVEFDEHTGDADGGPGCFELAVNHDGEFPTDFPRVQVHCCSAAQYMRFGLKILEAQVRHQRSGDAPIHFDQMSRDELIRIRDGINEILEGNVGQRKEQGARSASADAGDDSQLPSE